MDEGVVAGWHRVGVGGRKGGLAFDVEAGLVTREGARRYGVLLNDDLSVDISGTEALRREMATERGAVKLFDRGFDSIEELKARCKEETGLEAPRQPQFTRWAARAVGATKKNGLRASGQ